VAFSDETNLAVIDIEKANKPTLIYGNEGITKLVKFSVNHENNSPTFAGLTSHGVIKVLCEGESGGTMAKWIETVKVIKSGLGEITDIANLPNGSLISCGVDKSIYFWEEKKSTEVCACCQIF